MEQGQRLSDRLESIKQYEPDDINWFHFVTDHKQYIKDNSEIHRYTPEELVQYRYRPWEFCVDKCRLPGTAAWILMLVNDIRDPHDFNESHTKLYQFSGIFLSNLYQVYSRSSNHLNS